MLITLVLNFLIFQYRDIVIEVYQLLRRHHPLVKPMTFVGQSSAGKQSKGFTQKQQLKVRKQGLQKLFEHPASLLRC
jgi:ERCC4-related helicase